jgi:ActR/RegA family two-component response regulator
VAETILVVDDEEPVRRTVRDWLEHGDLSCEIYVAADAESALRLAHERTIDLAILDWNLGAGNNGLQLLDDLSIFNTNVVAVMITGFANQATPLDAMRRGVRDYLEKARDLNRETLLRVVRRQLEAIRPAKRERELHGKLKSFRDAVQKILPLVQTASAMNDPVPFTESLASLFHFLQQSSGATAGVLLVRSYDPRRQPAEVCRAYQADGQGFAWDTESFAHSLAGAVVGLMETRILSDLRNPAIGIRLQAFEQGHESVLAAPLLVEPGLSVVIELFDKKSGLFNEADQRLLASVRDFAAGLIKNAVAQQQTHAMLLEALGAALAVSEHLVPAESSPADQPPPEPVLTQLRESLEQSVLEVVPPEQSLRLAELLRSIAVRHGSDAIDHCIQLLEGVDRLLRMVTATE